MSPSVIGALLVIIVVVLTSYTMLVVDATPAAPVNFSSSPATRPHCLYYNVDKKNYAVRVCDDPNMDINKRSTFDFANMNNNNKQRLRAVAQYSRNTSNTGWDFFEVIPDLGSALNTTSVDAAAADQKVNDLRDAYYYAGFIEGYLTAVNLTQLNMTGRVATVRAQSQAALDFVTNHIQFMNTSVFDIKNKNDKYWNRVGMILNQLEGMKDGYNNHPDTPPTQQATFVDVFLRAYYFELEFDILPKFVSKSNLNNNNQQVQQNDNDAAAPFKPTHCSALIKLTDNDILVAHTSWFIFENMRRVMKLYVFDTAIHFSSYVGFVMSGDDAYLLRSNHSEMAVFETSLSVFNNTLSNLVSPDSVSEFIRVMVANYISADTDEWGVHFARLNSGTYNNQFAAIDYAKYSPGMTTLPKGTVKIYEQIPGTVAITDISSYISNNKYFGSYNVAYDHKIWVEAGYEGMQNKYGDFFGYSTTTRARIFARNQSMVQTTEDMQRMIRYNDYSIDPLSTIPNCSGTLPIDDRCTPAHSATLAIAQRGDISPIYNRTTGGPMWNYFDKGDHTAYDGKVMSYHNRKSLLFLGISGPPTATADEQATVIPPFVFTENRDIFPDGMQLPPEGLPDKWDFPWIAKYPACASCVECIATNDEIVVININGTATPSPPSSNCRYNGTSNNNNKNNKNHSLWSDKQSVGALIGGCLGLVGLVLVIIYLKRSRIHHPTHKRSESKGGYQQVDEGDAGNGNTVL